MHACIPAQSLLHPGPKGAEQLFQMEYVIMQGVVLAAATPDVSAHNATKGGL